MPKEDEDEDGDGNGLFFLSSCSFCSPAWPCSGTEPVLPCTRGAGTAPHCSPPFLPGSILPEDVFKSIPHGRLSSQLAALLPHIPLQRLQVKPLDSGEQTSSSSSTSDAQMALSHPVPPLSHVLGLRGTQHRRPSHQRLLTVGVVWNCSLIKPDRAS